MGMTAGIAISSELALVAVLLAALILAFAFALAAMFVAALKVTETERDQLQRIVAAYERIDEISLGTIRRVRQASSPVAPPARKPGP